MKHRYIVVEGVMGSGKTIFTKKLAAVMNADLFMENAKDNPFIENFYDNMQRYAFQTQMFFLLERYKRQLRFQQYELFNKVIISDTLFERDKLYASLLLEDFEFTLYKQIYNILEKEVVIPDLVIYLQTSTKQLKKNIRYYGRDFEKDISEDFIKDLNQKYNELFFNYEKGNLLIINTSDIDFDNKEDFNDIVSKIYTLKTKKIYYNPMSHKNIFNSK